METPKNFPRLGRSPRVAGGPLPPPLEKNKKRIPPGIFIFYPKNFLDQNMEGKKKKKFPPPHFEKPKGKHDLGPQKSPPPLIGKKTFLFFFEKLGKKNGKH